MKTGTAAFVLAALAAGRAWARPGPPKVQRFGWATGVKPEKIEYYKKLHANPWPAITRMIKACHIRNYSIYLGELEPGKFYLFSYLEYTGNDFAADTKKMAADPETERWWKETDPCQRPPSTKKDPGIWMDLERVFFLE
jgi:L-rhamnose mutarotase